MRQGCRRAQGEKAEGCDARVRAMLGHVLHDGGLTSGVDNRLTALGLAVVGLAFWWPLLRNSVTGFVFAAAVAGGAALTSAGALCLFAAVVLVGAAGGAWAVPRMHGVAPWLVPAGGLLATVANTAVLGLPGTGTAVVSAVLLGLVLVGFSAAWGVWLVGWATGGREVLLVAAASYAVSFAVGYLSYLPDPFSLVRPLGAPFLSGVCWYGCYRVSRGSLAGSPSTDSSSVPTLMRGLYLLVLVFFLVGSVATGFINTGSVAYVPTGGTLIRDTLSLGLTVGFIALTIVTRRLERTEFLLVSLAGAVQFAGIFIATFFGEGLVSYGAGLMQASKSWFSVILFVLVVTGCASDVTACARRVLLQFVVPVAASVGISYLGVPALVASFSIAYEGFWGTLSLAMGFFLGVLVFVFLSSMAVRSLPGEGAEEPAASGVASVEVVARALGARCGCTAREQDVLALLVAGNTYKRVAELLGVSENTVQYHSKNIYRKLGVHTKQELVDLVAQER